MQRLGTAGLYVLALAGGLGLGGAARTLGVATAPGEFRVDRAAVSGNATVFEGSLVETTARAARIAWQDGARLELGAGSAARVYNGRTILEGGTGRLRAPQNFQFEARGLQISSSRPNTVLLVSLHAARGVSVNVAAGAVAVRNGAGLVVAQLRAGHALLLSPGMANPEAVKLTGVVETRDGRYFLTDETTQVAVELQGETVPPEVGQCVAVEGALEKIDDRSVVQVSVLKRVESCGTSRTKAAAAAGGAVSAAAIGGITVQTIAIVGAVAAAGTVAGLGIAGELPGQSSAGPVSTSR